MGQLRDDQAAFRVWDLVRLLFDFAMLPNPLNKVQNYCLRSFVVGWVGGFEDLGKGFRKKSVFLITVGGHEPNKMDARLKMLGTM